MADAALSKSAHRRFAILPAASLRGFTGSLAWQARLALVASEVLNLLLPLIAKVHLPIFVKGAVSVEIY